MDIDYIWDTNGPLLPGDVVRGRMVDDESLNSNQMEGVFLEKKTLFKNRCYIGDGFTMILFDIKKIGTIPLETLLTHKNDEVRAAGLKRYQLEESYKEF